MQRQSRIRFLKTLIDKIAIIPPSAFLLAAILLLGVILRLQQYLYNRALWLDEARLALNILDRNYAGLFTRLEPFQVAPSGFLILVKACTDLFGDSELSLRIVSFIAGIVSLFLAYKFSADHFQSFGRVFFLSIVALSEPLIRYSAELKSYSVDTAMAFLLLLTALQIHRITNSRLRSVCFALVGG